MDNLAADFTIENNNPLEVSYELDDSNIDCVFEIYAAGTVWGSISGDIIKQTDLINILNEKVDLTSFNNLSDTVETLTGTVADNYSTLSGQISDLSGAVNDNYTSLDNRLTTAEGSILNLTDTVTDNNVAINNRVDGIVDTFDNDIDTLDGRITTNSNNITSIKNTINSYGDIVTYDAADFATATQGDLANSALQPNDNISELYNDVGFITSAELPTLEDLTTTAQINAINSGATTTNINQITTNTNNISALSGTVSDLSTTVQSNYTILDNKIVSTETTLQNDIDTLSETVTSNYNNLTQSITNNVSTLNTRITNEVSALNGAISDEETARTNADNNLQSQIDAITSASDVTDIVGTYAQLQAYDTTSLPNNSIIKVLQDESKNDETTYYRWVITNGVGAWVLIGEEGPYYTKSDTDSIFVPQARTINNKPLNQNISLSASDVGALPSSTQIGNGTITLTQGGVTKGTFTLNQTGNATIDFDAAGSTITIDSALSTSSENPVQNKVITTELNKKIEGITSSDITAALGYTPYNSTNPNGYITSEDLPTNYVTTDTAQNISGRKTFLGEKAIYFKQNATSNKLGFTLYNPSNSELGAFEYRPSTIGSGALLNVNVPISGSDFVGFRYWGTPAVNIVAPKVATGGNYYIPVNITNGTNTVTADNAGKVNINSLLPDVSSYLENKALGQDSLVILGDNGDNYNPDTGEIIPYNKKVIIGVGASGFMDEGVAIGYNAYADGSSVAIGANAKTESQYCIQIGPGTNGEESSMYVALYSFADGAIKNYKMLDMEGIIPDARLSENIARVSQIPDSTTFVTNTSLSTTLADYQPLLVDGTNIKTINGTSVLGSGDIELLKKNANDTTTGSLTFTLGASPSVVINEGYDYNAGTQNGNIELYDPAYDSMIPSIFKPIVSLRNNTGTFNIGGHNYNGSSVNVNLSVNGLTLYDGTTGLISDERLSSNIARTADVADELYFKSGDTFSVPMSYYAQVAGCFTSSQTTLQFNIPLPKIIPDGVTPTIKSLVLNARSGSGGYLIQDYSIASADSVSVSYVNGNTIWIIVSSSSAFKKIANNTATVITLYNLSISFE